MPSETETSAKERRELPDSVVRARARESPRERGLLPIAGSLRRFLSFIVEQRLAGQGHSLKESILAHESVRKGN